jgi:lipopolysaccharide transport system permease protein
MTPIKARLLRAFRPGADAPARIVLQPARGWSALRLGELWEYRDLLWFMTFRDLQARYRQMAFGPLWIVLQPVLNMVLYTVVFSNIARLPSAGQPYAVFAFTALLPWGVFNDTVSGASASLVANRHLMNKVYFPRLLFALSKVIISLIDFAIAL